MSVLHLLGSGGDGGAETYFLALAGALAREGVDQAFAIRPHPGREAALRSLGATVRTLPFGGPLDLTTHRAAAAAARAAGARALVAWMNRAARFAPRGPWGRIGRLGGYYNLKYYRGMDMLVANTVDIARWIEAKGWPADKIHYIPNFAAAPEAAPADRAALETPADAPLMLCLGRLHRAKAHDVALHALAQMPGTWLWIAGSGPLESSLKALARRLDVEDRVRFLGWRDDASSLYRAADLCLFPSRYEPLGNVVIQAWAHGTPIVAAASRGPAALIRDQEDGRLVPIDDAAALAEAAGRLLAEPETRWRLAEAGRARVAAEFSQAQVTDQWRELLARYGAA